MSTDFRPKTIKTLVSGEANSIAGWKALRAGAGVTYALNRAGDSTTAGAGGEAVFAHGLSPVVTADETLRVYIDDVLKTLTTHYALTAGAVGSISIGAGGTGYTLNDVLTVSQAGSGGDLTVLVTSVAAGVVDGVSIITAGSSYQIANGNATTGGTGSDCTIDVDSQVASTSSIMFVTAEIPTEGEVVSFDARTANAVVAAGDSVFFDTLHIYDPVYDSIVPTSAAVVEVM